MMLYFYAHYNYLFILLVLASFVHSFGCFLTTLDLSVQIPELGLKKPILQLKTGPISKISRTSSEARLRFPDQRSILSRDFFLPAREHLAAF